MNTQTLALTDGAAGRAKKLLTMEENNDLCLRVFITGGGCAGFQYGFTFDELIADDDTIIKKDGVSLLIDPLSLPYLKGATVDYQEDLEGSRFVVNNPNATTSCGCGSSFSIA
jgi:iron-sulfur cluster insertion protein